MCAYAHVLSLLWYPIIEYIESICRGEVPERTKIIGLNHAAIPYEMSGIVGSLGETLELDMFIDFIQTTLYRLLEVHAPTKLDQTIARGSGASES